MNESQKIYKTVMDTYASIARMKRVSIKPSTKISPYFQKKLAQQLSNFYCVPINNPKALTTIIAFAEHIKRYDMEKRLPQIEDEVRGILKNFFRIRVFSKDEPIFAGIGEPLCRVCRKEFQEEVAKRFDINLMYILRAEIFKHDFSIADIVDWIWLNEKMRLYC